MWIIVGLGNPGDRYAHDRHNIGFQIIDALRLRLPASSTETHRFQSRLYQGRLDTQADLLLIQPQTYMNLSGEAIAPICRFYQITHEHLLVIHDDLELPFGRLQLKRGGQAAGHNGLRSLNDTLDTNEYLRLRFGIGRPSDRTLEIIDYVLSPFDEAAEAPAIPALIDQSIEMIVDCCTLGETKAMNRWNRKKREAPQDEAPASEKAREEKE